MPRYELAPLPEQQKLFYGKATVNVIGNTEYLYSYHTLVMIKNPDGSFERAWVKPRAMWSESRLSATTLRHIKAFSGMNKREYLALPEAN